LIGLTGSQEVNEEGQGIVKIGIRFESVKNGSRESGEVSVEAKDEKAGKKKFERDNKQSRVIGTRIISVEHGG
jgi:hypothetical protein